MLSKLLDKWGEAYLEGKTAAKPRFADGSKGIWSARQPLNPSNAVQIGESQKPNLDKSVATLIIVKVLDQRRTQFLHKYVLKHLEPLL